MLQVVAGRRAAASLAAIALILFSSAALAQDEPASPPPDPLDEVNQPLDPSAPLEPWPDLGVEWPDMAVPDSEISDVPETPAGEAAAARTYAYRIDGLGDADSLALLTQFRALSALEEYRGDPANAAQIDRRARADADLLAELMRAYGYYDALVTTRVDAAPGGAFAVALEVQPGPLYRFAEVRLPGLDEATGADAPALREAFAISPQDPVNAAEVGAAQAALQAELGRRGYAFAELGEPDIVIDHDSRTATLVLPVEPQGTRRFGRILIDGAPLFSADHLATIARFDEGDPYRTPLVEDLRQALVATGLISSVTIRPVARPESDLVDIAVGIEPAPMRTIAGEAGYGTGEGVRAELSWQHRNLLPPEGAVTLRGVIGTREQLISGVLRRNNFLRRDQVLNAQVAASHTDRPGLQRPHLRPRRRDRAAEQHHLAEGLDLVGRRRADRDRRARRRPRPAARPAPHFLHRRAAGLPRL